MFKKYCVYCGKDSKEEPICCECCYEKLKQKYYEALNKIEELEDDLKSMGLA